ncbi:4-diphosphocytidyl-2C-methyl-D-erythritol kinase [Maribacter cobaltidurans]|nr:4-diphosphocytidyl-2C-methyl-D-erythritol kinase [Maribacter cobaltidurans]
MSHSLNIAVVVLAAGQSSRMGKIKQLLPWKDSFLLQHALRTVKEVDPDQLVLVLGANSDKIRPMLHFDDETYDVIENPTWEKGLGNSISIGVGHVLSTNHAVDGILICLGDQPLITSVYLQRLIDQFKTKKYSIIASSYTNRVGVPAIFNRSICHELVQLNSDTGAKDILLAYKDDILRLDAQELLEDIDTPEEYEKLYQRFHNT